MTEGAFLFSFSSNVETITAEALTELTGFKKCCSVLVNVDVFLVQNQIL